MAGHKTSGKKLVVVIVLLVVALGLFPLWYVRGLKGLSEIGPPKKEAPQVEYEK